jgi:hypothetical protein
MTPLLLVALPVAAVTLGYVIACLISPAPRCWACRGRGYHLWGMNTCSVCKGDRVRLRWGVRLARTYRSPSD